MKKWSLKTIVDVLALVAMLVLFLHYIPAVTFNSAAPTGGDIGSHYWPFKLLIEHGLPELRIKMWNPGNLMGEPILIHYFPLPYIWMLFLYPFMSMAAAFKLGTLLGGIFFPFAVYFGARGLGLKFPTPIIAAAFSLFFSFNESFSQWGGNNVSTLSGQFAHQEALMFLFLWIGALGWEIRNRKMFIGSALAGAAVCCSHSYVFLLVPFFCLSFWWFYPVRTMRERFIHLFFSGIFTLLLSAWFLIPMLDNNNWVTPMAIVWGVESLFRAVIPESLDALKYVGSFVAGLMIAALSFSKVSKSEERETFFEFLFWSLPLGFSVACYWIFPKIGLVDVRAIPQIQIILFVWVGLLLGRVVALWPNRAQILAAILIVAGAITHSAYHVVNFPYWMQWNNSGWQTKPHYQELISLSQQLEYVGGIPRDFSSPRVAYEHNEINGEVGTPRVFEMLPYFAKRATLESVYLQATITANFAFYNQALISLTPSCPFREIPCPPHNLSRAVDLAPVLGISDYIFVTPTLKADAAKESRLVDHGGAGPWKIYSLKEPVSLVETMKEAPKFIPRDSNWRNVFFHWLEDYKTDQQTVIATNGDNDIINAKFDKNSECKPLVVVNFNRMKLITNCPGTAHILKFAYHPSWKASTGDEIYLVSPGYMAIVPSAKEVTFEFGRRLLWDVSNFLTIWAFLILFVFWLQEKGYIKKTPLLRKKKKS